MRRSVVVATRPRQARERGSGGVLVQPVRPRRRRRDATRGRWQAVAIFVMALLLGGVAVAGAVFIVNLAPRIDRVVEFAADMFRSAPPATPLALATPQQAPAVASFTSGPSPSVVALSGSRTPAASPTTIRALAYEPARLKDTLGQASVAYTGLLVEQTRNIEEAVTRLNGAAVAPGQVLSFNTIVFDRQELGLAPTSTQLPVTPTVLLSATAGVSPTRTGLSPTSTRTATPLILTVPFSRFPTPRLGANVNDLATGPCLNGLCLVATALFQAGFGAGFGVIERHPHPIWNTRFGPAGQDAVVEVQRRDLKLRNLTGDWVRLESWADGRAIGVALIGSSPGWIVVQPPPVVTAIVAADVNPVRRDDQTLEVGRSVFVEEAADGFDVIVSRTVIQEGRIVDEYRQYDRYQPARNVVIVGVKGATSTPTITPLATATGTPTFTPTLAVSNTVTSPITATRPANVPPPGTPPPPGATPTPGPPPPPGATPTAGPPPPPPPPTNTAVPSPTPAPPTPTPTRTPPPPTAAPAPLPRPTVTPTRRP